MKLGMIGTGVMAGAMLRAAVGSGVLEPQDIILYDKNAQAAQAAAKASGAQIALSAAALVERSDIVQFGVKPQDLPALLASLGGALKARNPLIISIAAGVELAGISRALPYAPRAVRLMPNINATVGEAITAYCPTESVSTEELAFVERYCASFGKALRLEERYFSAFLAMGSSAPAFVYLFIDELARAGVTVGLGKAQALEIAAQTVLGSAKQVAESGRHPYELIDKVCSPGGTTIAGINVLRENRFAHAISQAVQASYRRDRELGNEQLTINN
ncbi:MAG: pyrroline-5-carboxylate reductase [Oscillospiraceae bacterium]|nr:pyrroline-5-carboxylate reductase [Oscillospiraceae bacterium]